MLGLVERGIYYVMNHFLYLYLYDLYMEFTRRREF
jgi:hypothetical protein